MCVCVCVCNMCVNAYVYACVCGYVYAYIFIFYSQVRINTLMTQISTFPIFLSFHSQGHTDGSRSCFCTFHFPFKCTQLLFKDTP